MKTGATNKKVRELVNMVRDGKLVPRPEFQRRLVWSQKDKNFFLDTLLRGLPFPEIYLADGEVDLDTGEGTQLLVDGLQRVSTLVQYFTGDSDLKLSSVPPYKELTEEQKTCFLQYDVAVRDLGSVTREALVEVFTRLNATKYSLLDIEVNNAVYSGALKQFSEKLSEDRLFIENRVFNALDYKRMGDLRFALTIVISMIEGYFNRDDSFGDLLERYNDEFPLQDEIAKRYEKIRDLIEECGFPQKMRVWKKADLLTLIVELDRLINASRIALQPHEIIERLESFYSHVEDAHLDDSNVPGIYYKAALQASNDRLNRIRRGVILEGILIGKDYDGIFEALKEQSLIG